MVIILTRFLTPYQKRYLQTLLTRHGLVGRVYVGVVDGDVQDQGVLIGLGEVNELLQQWLQRAPWWKVHLIPTPPQEYIGVTANLDIQLMEHPERQRLHQLLTELRNHQAMEVSEEIFYSLADFENLIQQYPMQVLVCVLNGLQIGIYPATPQGRYPVELTIEDFRRLAFLREKLHGRLVVIKDRFGTCHQVENLQDTGEKE